MKSTHIYPFPKIELHLHLDGSILPETMWELMQKENVPLPTDSFEAFMVWLRETANCRNVNTFLERFELPLQILQKPEYLTRATEEIIDRFASENYGYAEIRFAPQLHNREQMSQKDAVEAVLLGRENALRRHPGLGIGILLCTMSVGPETLNMKENLETVRLTKEYLGKGVVGCDLAGAEGIVPLHNFHPIFDLARELEVPFTCHAGDSQGKDTIEDALAFGTKRIGHGHAFSKCPELWAQAVKDGITLEICPTSNVQCCSVPSYSEHPAKKLFDAGFRVTINTDNSTLSAVTLAEEYDHCLDEMGFEYKDLVLMNMNAARAAFMPEDERDQLLEKLQIYL